MGMATVVARVALGVGLVCGATSFVAAQTDMVSRVNAKSRQMEAYLALLRSPVQATRIAAVGEMVSSGDPVLADLAVETALGSSDPVMQALGLRAGFRQVRSLVAKLAPVRGSEGAEVAKACGDAVQYRIEKYNYDNGTFEAHGQDNTGVGQVNGKTVSITIEYGCSLTGVLQADGSFSGLVSAPYKKGSLPMRATFR